MEISEFAIYYDDESVLTSADGEWEAFPDTGVAVLVLFYDAYDEAGVPRRRVIVDHEYQLETHPQWPKYGSGQPSTKMLNRARAATQRPAKTPTNTLSTKTPTGE